ncbi:MAG: FHA domain-containing protein [Ardenticatenia bacterium]|nr:FHA domain-containing protein [Ardenticatenia bacterium]
MIPPEIGWLLLGALIGFIAGSLVTWQLRQEADRQPHTWDTTETQRLLRSVQATAPQVVANLLRRSKASPSPGRARRSAPVAVLRSTRGLHQGETFLIRSLSTLTIGRADDADVVLDEEGVSRFHAQITHRPDPRGTAEFTIIDYSRNGTLLNGRPIKAVASLEDGDIIQVGSTTLVFQKVRR